MMTWPEDLKLAVLARTDAAKDSTERAAILEEYGVPRTTWLYWIDRRKRGLLSGPMGRPSEFAKAVGRVIEPVVKRVERLEKIAEEKT